MVNIIGLPSSYFVCVYVLIFVSGYTFTRAIFILMVMDDDVDFVEAYYDDFHIYENNKFWILLQWILSYFNVVKTLSSILNPKFSTTEKILIIFLSSLSR